MNKPKLKEGEYYAGIILDKDDEPDYHLILLPGDKEDINWHEANKWASEIGGGLPNRREQSLLFANLKEQFKECAYWSNEQHASNSDYAWCQIFGYGLQGASNKGGYLRARAVRRLPI